MLLLENAAVTARGDKPLLADVTASFAAGKVYGLIGHNGSGKSTLIRLLAGETAPSQGKASINGEAIAALTPKARAKQIAYLPQALPDAADFLAEELVMLGRFARQKWLQKASREDKQAVADAMQMTGTAAFAKQPVNTLSGGERQRVWLAMCLAQQCSYLLLDEPLAALDIVYQLEVLQLIRRLADEQNLTVIIIIHDLNLAARFCDELIALKGGRLLLQDKASSVMQPDTLKAIFGVDFQLLAHPNGRHKVAVL